MRRLLIVAAAVAVAAVLFVVLRPADDSEATQSTTTTTSTSTTTTAEPPPALPPPPRVVRLQIVVKEGKPVGGVGRVTVAEGQGVVLIVTSDVADEVHLHGYNVARGVAPGRPARITFRATIVGTVEAELEQSGVPLARITTKP